MHFPAEPAPRPSPTTRPRVTGASLPFAWLLALLITGMLAAAVIALLIGARQTLVDNAEANLRDRLVRTARELATSSAQTSAPRVAAARRAARDTVITGALQAASRRDDASRPDEAPRLSLGIASGARVQAALERVRIDTGFASIELWNADGARVAFVGEDVPATQRPSPGPAGADSAWHGSMRVDRGAISTWTAVPVVHDGRPLGWVAYRRYFRGSSNTTRILRELFGDDVMVRVRNADGSLWVDASGGLVPVPVGRDSGRLGPRLLRQGGIRTIAVETPVRNFPWLIVLEVPELVAYARPMRTLRRLALLGAVVVVAGAIVAWLLGRRLARPLSALTIAAEEVSLGTYEHAVISGGGGEVARLGASFDAMARQVATARQELERRASDAQAQAEELSLANARLREAMETAERASRAKGDFLAVMSHELRTPLNAIGGYTDLIALGIYGPVDPAQRDALERITRSQRHLLSLIDDVLSFARLEGGRAEFVLRDVTIDDVVRSVEPLVAPQARARSIALHLDACDRALVARADADKLRQVVLNLLANAIKFTPEGGQVRVSCEGDAGHVHLRVADTGPGIPGERLEAIFEPFVQGDRALNRPTEGVGLGLAISRDLARGMGGSLTVRSVVGEGATFTLSLVRARAGVAAPGARLPGAPSVIADGAATAAG